MSIKRGDIFWIEQSKYRPAVGSVQKPGLPGIVVSNDANNACSPTLEIVYLTGKPKKDLPTHCAINSAPKPGVALCEQVTAVSSEQIREYVGTCTKEEMEQIDRCITISLGLPDPLEDLRKAMREAADIKPGEKIYDPMTHIHNLELDLAAANARARMMTELYNNLLERTIG